jgi:multidrug efflux pump
MILSRVAITRPVFATVINLMLVVLGLLAFFLLPVRQYPAIDPPVVTVNTSYTGASAAVVESEITKPVEEALSGISGITLIQATSYDEASSVEMEFSLDRDVDLAAADVRDKIGRIGERLPEEADDPVIIKESASDRPMMWISITSDSRDPLALTDYAKRELVDRFSVVNGVSRVIVGGERAYAMRIWLDRDLLSLRSLTVPDVVRKLQSENIEIPAGRLESDMREIGLRVIKGLDRPEDFAALVLRDDNGGRVTLGDVGRVEVGATTYRTGLWFDGKTAVGMGVVRQSQSNTLEVANGIKAILAELQQEIPDDLHINIPYDESNFIEQSQTEVKQTLAIAFGLVVLVILLFLRSLSATIVPTLAIPVSLIATAMVMLVLGFSINVLTMLALVLAIGLVVDDTIVVLENIHRRMELGEPRLLAAMRGTQEVAFAVLTTTMVLVAVFIPLAFQTDQVGRLFNEFGLTLAACVVFSSVVALTWAPMLSSKLLRESGKHDADRVEQGGYLMHLLIRGYRFCLRGMLAPMGMAVSLLATLAVAGLGVLLFMRLPNASVPTEDQGYILIIMQAPEGSSIDYATEQVQTVEQRLNQWQGDGPDKPIENVISIVSPGFRPGASPNEAFIILRLKSWHERSLSQQALQEQLFGALFFGIPGANIIPINPPSFPGIGFGQPVQVAIGADETDQAIAWAQRLEGIARANPGLQRPEADVDLTRPQIQLRIDRDRAADLGVSSADIGVLLQVLMGGQQITRYEERGRQYDVILRAEAEQRTRPEDLTSLYLRSSTSGSLVPLSNLIEAEPRGVPRELKRIQRRPAAVFQAGLNPGYTVNQALDYVQQQAKANLPSGHTLTPLGASKQAAESSAGILFTYAMALVVVYLALAAQFESFIHPLIIISAVPLAMTGALGALALFGVPLTIYAQIGLVMLVGLMAKNGILIVEFANQLRDRGEDLYQATLRACQLRLRPILMTALSTIIGAVPLALASGAGAEGRLALGVVIIGGMTLATLLTLLVLPSFYYALARFTKPAGTLAIRLSRQQEDYEHRM